MRRYLASKRFSARTLRTIPGPFKTSMNAPQNNPTNTRTKRFPELSRTKIETPSAMSVTAFIRTERSADEIGLNDDMGTPVFENQCQKPGLRRGNLTRRIG